MNQQPRIGDIYAALNRIHNKWVLWQVIKDKDKDKPKLGIIMLDWFATELPIPNQITKLQPLFIDHHYWQGKYNLRYLSNSTPPQNYQWIANIEPVTDIEITCYGDWPSPNYGAEQYEWREIPDAERTKFRNAINSTNKVLIMGNEYMENSHKIQLREKDESIRWDDLNFLPALSELHFEGNDLSIIDYLQTRTLIQKLCWEKHRHSRIDLRNTHLKHLIIDITHLSELHLPDGLRFLSLTGDYKNLHQLKIMQQNHGEFLQLHLYSLGRQDIPRVGLKNLNALSMRIDRSDFSHIVQAYPNLSSLHAWGNPGIIQHFDQLKLLKNLEDIQFEDLFGFTENDFPKPNEMPVLNRIWLTSIPASVGKWVKRHYKNASNLHISKLRSDSWLEANLDNPFRAWEGREGVSASKAKKAFEAYKNACASISKLNNSRRDPENEKQIITEFTQVFNKMEAKDGIDTLEREEIANVFGMLVEKMKLSENIYDDYFDSIREF